MNSGELKSIPSSMFNSMHGISSLTQVSPEKSMNLLAGHRSTEAPAASINMANLVSLQSPERQSGKGIARVSEVIDAFVWCTAPPLWLPRLSMKRGDEAPLADLPGRPPVATAVPADHSSADRHMLVNLVVLEAALYDLQGSIPRVADQIGHTKHERFTEVGMGSSLLQSTSSSTIDSMQMEI